MTTGFSRQSTARFANVFFGELRDTLFGRVTERAMRRIGLTAFRHVHSLELDYHLNRRTGGLARDIERGTTGISFLLRFFVFNIAPTLFEIVMVAGILLFNYGGTYAGVVVTSVVAYALFSFRATEWRTRFVRAVNEADSSSNTRAVDSLLNYETVKYFTNEGYEADRYDRSLAEWEQARRSNRLSLFALNAGQALIIALSQTAVIGLAAWQVSSGVLSIGDFVLINQFMLQLFMPLGFLGFVYREIKSSLANIENLFALLDREPAIRDAPAARSLAVGGGEVVFDAVSFHYPNGRPVLDADGRVRSSAAPARIRPLKQQLVDQLDREGELLLALQSVRQADRFQHQRQQLRLQQHRRSASTPSADGEPTLTRPHATRSYA